jgi:hypothetical protein
MEILILGHDRNVKARRRVVRANSRSQKHTQILGTNVSNALKVKPNVLFTFKILQISVKILRLYK